MNAWIVRTIPPIVALSALVCSLSADSYGRFSLPFRERVTPMWEEWRQTSLGQALNGKADGCKSEPNLKTRPITAATWTELKGRKLEELTPDRLVASLGNPLCILPDGTIRYLPDFTDSTLDIRLTSKGITYDLNRNQPGAMQPRLSVPGAATPQAK
ncbi:MAG TPA: hypothetical protein V6D18_17765 [Thermosynechococcaceae cyanobacterium]